MRHYILKRCIQLIPILFGITFLSFSMMHLTADDAVDMLYEQSGAVSEEVKTARRAQLGLDQPFLVQYGSWLAGVLTGDMGQSYVSNKRVFETFATKLPATAELMLASLGATLLLATPLGVWAAVRQNTWIDYFLRCASFVGNSLPNFFVALLLIYFFALKLELLPIMGNQADWHTVILPACTLAISMGAKYMRQIRAVVLDELEKPYVEGARARGIPEGVILFRSVLKSVCITIITLAALSCGSLLGGTAIVESIFMWDGVGKMAVDAILTRDYPLIQAYVIWMSVIYVLVNLIADLIYHYLDPRVHVDESGEG
ncbi:nickel ABC transporter permease [Anaeromusa sp.]|uniref:nickel ABC transporter permease n=1 Tax=Anaeromusa sp. TaxID=1872520 RepID=UPI0026211F76|nr:nickel ABC transporter permease [Anaeromusa sp.]MDD3158024.1 ABC transporter permease [Anaeromusa sp.]